MTSATEAMHIDDREDENGSKIQDSEAVRDGDFDSADISKMLDEEPSQHPLDRLRAIMLEATFDVLFWCHSNFDHIHLAMLCK